MIEKKGCSSHSHPGSDDHRLESLEHRPNGDGGIPPSASTVPAAPLILSRRKKYQTAKAAPAKEVPRPARQNGATLSSQGGQPKISKDKQEDDLKKIHGIGPAFAQTLHKMGTRTFIQIARWKPEDVEKIAKKLDADPERIKRENWIADAKKQHYRKYGERA